MPSLSSRSRLALKVAWHQTAISRLPGFRVVWSWFSYCISPDSKADDYVTDIFGRQYTVIDHVELLSERLPHLFMALTK